MDLDQIKAELKNLPADQLREVLAEFAPGDGTEKDLAEIQYSLAADRQEFLRSLAAFRSDDAFHMEAAEELLGPEARETVERMVNQGKLQRDGSGYVSNWTIRDLPGE